MKLTSEQAINIQTETRAFAEKDCTDALHVRIHELMNMCAEIRQKEIKAKFITKYRE